MDGPPKLMLFCVEENKNKKKGEIKLIYEEGNLTGREERKTETTQNPKRRRVLGFCVSIKRNHVVMPGFLRCQK